MFFAEGLFQELNPGNLAPEARIMPLDQTARCWNMFRNWLVGYSMDITIHLLQIIILLFHSIENEWSSAQSVIWWTNHNTHDVSSLFLSIVLVLKVLCLRIWSLVRSFRISAVAIILANIVFFLKINPARFLPRRVLLLGLSDLTRGTPLDRKNRRWPCLTGARMMFAGPLA